MLNMLMNKDINNLYPLYSALAMCLVKHKGFHQQEVHLMNLVQILQKGMMDLAIVESSKTSGKFLHKNNTWTE